MTGSGLTHEQAVQALLRSFPGCEPVVQLRSLEGRGVAVVLPGAEDRDRERQERRYGDLLLSGWRNVTAAPALLCPDSAWTVGVRQSWAWGSTIMYSRMLLIGTEAAGFWRRDLTVRELEGRWGAWDDRALVMCVRDPFLIDDKRAKVQWRMHVSRFFTACASDAGTWLFDPTCVKCYRPIDRMDRDGIGWCKKHQGLAKAGTVDVNEVKGTRATGQGELL